VIESLSALAGPLVNALSSLKIRNADKRKLGHAFSQLYLVFNEIIENGDNILKELRKAKNGKEIDSRALLALLVEQSNRIKRVKILLKKANISRILKIHLPEVTDIEVLVEMKGERIALFTEQLIPQKLHRFRPVLLDSMMFRRGMYLRDDEMVVPPTETILRAARRNLTELNTILKQLREFLVEKFEIDEII